jgi:hypothetical protein
LSNKDGEKEAFVIKYELENDFNAGIGNAKLVVSHRGTKALKVTNIIAFLIILATKIGKKRGRLLKVTFNTKKPVVTAKQYKRPKKDTISIPSLKPSEKRK